MKTLVWVGPNVSRDVFELVEQFDRVILIEPLEECCDLLFKELGDRENLFIICAACGVTEGIQEFHTYNCNGVSSSFGKVTQEARDKFKTVDWNDTTTREVNVVNLGKLLDAFEIEKVDRLIIDAQGMDLTILKTIETQLKRHDIKSLQTEADNGFQHYEDLDNRLENQESFMESCGYQLVSKSQADFHPDVEWAIK